MKCIIKQTSSKKWFVTAENGMYLFEGELHAYEQLFNSWEEAFVEAEKAALNVVDILYKSEWKTPWSWKKYENQSGN